MNALLFLAAAASMNTSFDCQIDTPHAISVTGDTANANAIGGLPSESMKFQLTLKGSEARVDWPNSPIQMNGKQVVLPTGPYSGMVLFLAGGPCLFTEAACGSLFNYALQPDGTLRFLITPSAVATNNTDNSRAPFLVMIDGRCAARNSSK